MKRLVTLGITLALVMGLFCFSVNAENIVIQGESDTVTATYGSNDITIALRARKLRVINTGTAAAGYAGYTPVIVSVTIFNLGNQNCLVNNLKFRLTSESAEYRIAGFENISPDLFISDTAYDATGYLSLKASNDYTYGGGFVVPANSNMTYVGIINISANWITENQTWRTVNLSTATFYDNLTTTVGDYSCAAEPIDLTYIHDNLDDILTAVQGIDLDVSTMHNLLSDLVDTCTYNGADAQNLSPGINSSSTSDNSSYSGVRISAYRYIGNPVYSALDYEYNSENDTAPLVGTIRYPFQVRILVQNNTNTVISSNYIHCINNLFPSNAYIVHIDYFYSDLYNTIFTKSDKAELMLKHKIDNDNYRCAIPLGGNFTIITGYIEYSVDTTVTWNSISFDTDSSGVRPLQSISGYYPNNEYTILRDLYLAYTSVNGVNDLSDAASDAADQASTIHNQEASYYAQNQAAIEATGLNNFQFSGEQSNGIGSVSNDFTALWNALGSWNSVYIFSMTLTLALTILRHVPNRRKPKEKNSE